MVLFNLKRLIHTKNKERTTLTTRTCTLTVSNNTALRGYILPILKTKTLNTIPHPFVTKTILSFLKSYTLNYHNTHCPSQTYSHAYLVLMVKIGLVLEQQLHINSTSCPRRNKQRSPTILHHHHSSNPKNTLFVWLPRASKSNCYIPLHDTTHHGQQSQPPHVLIESACVQCT